MKTGIHNIYRLVQDVVLPGVILRRHGPILTSGHGDSRYNIFVNPRFSQRIRPEALPIGVQLPVAGLSMGLGRVQWSFFFLGSCTWVGTNPFLGGFKGNPLWGPPKKGTYSEPTKRGLLGSLLGYWSCSMAPQGLRPRGARHDKPHLGGKHLLCNAWSLKGGPMPRRNPPSGGPVLFWPTQEEGRNVFLLEFASLRSSEP